MNLLIQYAMSFVGNPYIWGGSGGDRWDCSGLVQEILKSCGNCPPGDNTAQSLYDYFEKATGASYNIVQPGSLAFYGKDALNVVHVAFCVDSNRMIEAGGGGSLIRTVDDARTAGAFVRMRPIKRRKDFLVCIKPSYVSIGLI